MAEQPMSSSAPTEGAILFRVVREEAEWRLVVGTMSVHPSLEFRELQLALSRMVRRLLYQITPFLGRPTYERIPIDEKLDLSVMSREGGEWHVLAWVERPRDARICQGHRTRGGVSADKASSVPMVDTKTTAPLSAMAEQLMSSSAPAEGALLLRVVREEAKWRLVVGTMSVHPSLGFRELQLALSRMVGRPLYQITPFLGRPMYERIPIDEKLDLSDVSREGGEWHVLALVERPRDAQICHGRSTRGGARADTASRVSVVCNLMRAPEPAQAACAVCDAAVGLGVDAAFHCCVRDKIVEVGPFFRSSAGPIKRPSRRLMNGCA